MFYRKFLVASFFVGFLIGLAFSLAYAAGVNINLVVANGSTAETKTLPIKYYLPKELHEEDILNSAGLRVDYDIDKSVYYVSGSAELKPKESKTFKIEVKDVWHIDPQEVEILKTRIDQNLAQLQGTTFYDSGTILRNNMTSRIDRILGQQVSYSDNVERRIEEYRSHVDMLEEIRRNAFSPEYLKSTVTVEEEEATRTVKFVIEVKNASDKAKKLKQKHYLPKEVRSENIVDAQGFDVRFDEEKQQSYLFKEDDFKANEAKRYEIEIKDIWNISENKIALLEKRADTAFNGVKDSEYKESASFLTDQIKARVEEIKNSQKDKSDMAKYVGAYRANKGRYAQNEEDILKLEKMLAAVQAKKLAELENSKVANVLQKLTALRGITALSKAIFGKKPSVTTTWKVIWGILAFVGFFTALHFFTWWKKSQVMGEELAIQAGGAIKQAAKAKEKDEEEEKK